MQDEYTASVRLSVNLWTVPKSHFYNTFNASKLQGNSRERESSQLDWY